MLKDPQVSFVEKQTYKRDVVPAEASRFFPDITVAEEANDGRGMPGSAASLFAPDPDLDEPSADFVDWLFCHGIRRLLREGLNWDLAKKQ